MQQPWYKGTWGRVVLDMHITDDDERFLSGYDPQAYAALLEKARTKSGVIYAMGHVGLALYPSKVLPQHRGLKGRDAFGETVAACHARGIGVSAYMKNAVSSTPVRDALRNVRVRDGRSASKRHN